MGSIPHSALSTLHLKWCRVKELHPQPPRSERGASAGWANAAKLALPAGLSPATATFEASHSDNLSYGSVKNRDAKAELNRHSQVCEALTGTGIRVAENETLIFANLR